MANSNTLAGYGYASSGYQVGLGPNTGQAAPIDLYLLPASGSSISPQTSTLVVTGSGTIAALTVVFPSNAVEGQRLRIIANQAVTTLTLTAGTNGVTGANDTIVGGVSSLTANTPVEYAYKLTQATNTAGQATPATNIYSWYRVQ